MARRSSLLAAFLACALGADAVVLRTSRTELVLSEQKRGAIVSLLDTPTGTEFVNAEAAQDLFLLGCTVADDRAGKLEWLASQSSEQVEYQTASDRVTMTFSRVGGRDVTVVCVVSASPEDGSLRWGLQVTGSERLVVEDVHFPVIELRAGLHGDGRQDAFVAGLTKGGVFRNPSQWDPKRWGVLAHQPGALAAQFGCYYSPAAGFMSHTRDARGYPKALHFRRTSDGFRWIWRRHCYQRLDRPFALGYEISMSTFAGADGQPADWRDAADIYKRWTLTQPWCGTRYAERTDVPDWLKTGPAMIRFSRNWLGAPERIDAWLTDYWLQHFPRVPLIVALWGWERVGSWVSPHYFPPFPSEEGFSRIVSAAKRAGGHCFPWPSGYYWNVEYNVRADGTFEQEDWEEFNRTARPHALVTRTGEPLVRKLRWLRGGRNACLCRGDPWTRRWFTTHCVELMKRGCDMVQVDQVVGGAAPGNGNCFSASHGHAPGPGVWDAEAFAEQLRSLADACRRVESDAVLSIEEPQELFNHLIGVQDYRDCQVAWQPQQPGHVPESVFGYLYHEYLPVFQSNPRAGDKLNLAHCIVTGQIPHWVPHWPVTPSPMLRNGDVEEWEDNVPSGWQKVTGWQGRTFAGSSFRDDDVKHHGTTSLRLENASEDDGVQVSQNVDIGPHALVPGRTYRLRVWLKVEHMSASNGIGLAALVRQGLKSKGSWRIPFPAAGEWELCAVEFTVPEQADFLRLMIHVNGRCRLWCDAAAIDERAGVDWRPLMRRGLPAEHELVTQWVELFHGEGRPYLHLGKMLHPPTLLAPARAGEALELLPPILLNAFEAPDGSRAAIAVNVTDAEQTAVLRWLGREWELAMRPWQVRLVRASAAE